MTLFRLLAATCALIGLSAEASAQTVPEPVPGLFLLTLDREALRTDAGRDALALAAASYCEEVDRRYPRNSPAEEEWLTTEIAAQGDRMLRAAQSAEFGRRATAAFTTTCNSFADAYQQGSHQTGLIGMAYAFVRYDGDAEFYAKKNGVDARELGLAALGSAGEALIFAALMEAQTE